MDTIILLIFLLCVIYLYYSNNTAKQLIDDKPTHRKPKHTLRNILYKFSSGDKINLIGDCSVNLYTKNTISSDMKHRFIKLIDSIFKNIYGLTDNNYVVLNINNIYEQIDKNHNARYILDITINSTKNYYTVKVIIDIVILNDDILINYIGLNDASNNNIINRYDIVYQDQGILLEHNNFTENISKLLNNKYQKHHKLINVNINKLDTKNYNLDNVLTLNSLLNGYYPATTSVESIQSLENKGIDGLLESYFPNDLVSIESPDYCNKLNGEKCIFNRNSTSTEYTQPYMAPGLFFDRSSYPLN